MFIALSDIGTPRLIILVLITVALVYMFFHFNKLKGTKKTVQETWNAMGTLLRKRHHLVPQLLKTVEDYKKNDQEVLSQLATLHRIQVLSPSGVKPVQSHENSLSVGLKGLFSLLEAYPDLKADFIFKSLIEKMIAVENDIERARRYYNEAARSYNSKLEGFPENLIAIMLRFTKADFFEIQNSTDRVQKSFQ